MLMHQPGLSVDKADGPLMTGGDTRAAAIALFLVNMNDLTDHKQDPLVDFCSQYTLSAPPRLLHMSHGFAIFVTMSGKKDSSIQNQQKL